jgi:serine O-acetyltransferase
VDSIHGLPALHRLGHGYLPNRDIVHRGVRVLLQLVFPGYFGRQGLTEQSLPFHVGELVGQLFDEWFEPVRYCLRFRDQAGDCPETGARCDAEAERVLGEFLASLPEVRESVSQDVSAHYDGDPAAGSPEETIFSYPGLYAIAVQRMAHRLHRASVPLLPRAMTEFAHAHTGIDIHPGATLGPRLFIDHGTGVVIGETATLGTNVKLYQGVTLGALAPAKGQQLRGCRRHPSIGQDVTIYAGATILGGETHIGDRSTIGGNVFLTQSVPPDTRVVAEPPRLRYRNGQTPASQVPVVLDFQI